MATTASKEGKTGAGFTVIGTRPVRHDGVDKVTGRARYGADIRLPGLLHGRVLRSPHAHARIRSIDVRRAEAFEGVSAVATSDDFAIVHEEQELDVRAGVTPRMMADNDLAREKVLYKGHAVAEAAGGDGPAVRGNVASHIQHKRGDVGKGFREAEVIVEREFTTETVHQGYIEPFAATADWSEEGHVTIWTSTQGIFTVRTNTAAILGLPESAVKVVPMEVGGGFGGKGVGYLEPVAAVLSRESGWPVKMVMTRQEVFEATGPTSGAFMRCKIGATRDGRITAAQLYLVYEAGAYPGSPVGGGVNTGLGPYRLDNMLVDGYDVVCNRPKTQAYRAPGHPQAAFAVESAIDELAGTLGMDPLDLRIKNAAREGDRAPNGVLHARFGCGEVMEAMKAHPSYIAPLGGPNRGRGAAVGYRFNGGGSGSSATVNVNSSGIVSVITGSADLSGTRVALAMQAAELLGIPVDDIVPTVVDTDSVGFTGNSGGSRITFDTGRAVLKAAEEVIRQMAERAALIWEISPEEVEFTRGVFISGNDPEDRLSFKDLAGRLMETGGPVTASASDAQGGVGAQLAGNIVDVEVDPETGKVDILRYTTFLDAGQAVHPSYVEGQMQGGALQGVGWALHEEYFYSEDGAMANATFLDYRMPTTLDLPMIDTVIIEVANPRHPFGIRGVGEAPIVPPLGALANAVHAATGVRMTRLPMTPAAIREAMTDVDAES